MDTFLREFQSPTAAAIVTVVGALAYGLAKEKVQELGRLSFFAGLLALLMG